MLQLESSAMNRTVGQGHIFIDFVSSVHVYRGHIGRTKLLRETQSQVGFDLSGASILR